MFGVAPGFGRDVNQQGYESLSSGEFHVGYAALGVVVLGVLLLAVSLWVGVLLVILGTAIFVDCWAHGWFH